jgi:hypothetical protein
VIRVRALALVSVLVLTILAGCQSGEPTTRPSADTSSAEAPDPTASTAPTGQTERDEFIDSADTFFIFVGSGVASDAQSYLDGGWSQAWAEALADFYDPETEAYLARLDASLPLPCYEDLWRAERTAAERLHDLEIYLAAGLQITQPEGANVGILHLVSGFDETSIRATISETYDA